MNTKTLTHSTAGIAPIFQRPASKTMLKQKSSKNSKNAVLPDWGSTAFDVGTIL